MLRSLDIYNSGAPQVQASEVNYVDPNAGPGKMVAGGGSALGARYLLDTPYRVDSICGLRILSTLWLNTMPPNRVVASLAQQKVITVTLKTYASEVIVNQMPIVRLWPGHAPNGAISAERAWQYLYFAPGRIVDPRQSYFQWWKGNQTGVVPYQFLYW